jgi:hypothetical protein
MSKLKTYKIIFAITEKWEENIQAASHADAMQLAEDEFFGGDFKKCGESATIVEIQEIPSCAN